METVRRGLAPLREFDTVYGFKLVSPARGFSESQADGTFEPDEMKWAADLLRSGSVDAFVDAGANVGLYTMLALKHGIPTMAIEPQKKNVKALKAGLKANGYECRVAPVALSDREGTATMFGISPCSASLVKNWNTEISAIHRTVATATLDNLLHFQFGGKRLLIKVDLEGNEWPALLGAAATLAREPKPIWMVEIVDFAFDGGVHPNKGEIFNLFERHGYRATELTKENWVFE
jgi:FkbM family methyltransferase